MPYRIVGIGEILWAIFPDGPRFGGAPANFACSAAELAQETAEVCMVSAVGTDQLGDEAIRALQQRRVSTSFVQRNSRPTGRVVVELDDAGAASYRFDEDSAWDHIACNHALQSLAGECYAVCFGTLGGRSDLSRETIRNFVASTPESALRILDVNLRAPYFCDELILDSLSIANVLKLNDEELPVIARLAGCVGDADETDVLFRLARRFKLRCVALTRGANGAVVIAGESVSELPGTAVRVTDTVGAGDAYTASMTLDLLAGRGIAQLNRNAVAAASYVCSESGATMPFPKELQRGQQN